jgi:hypothetical protein
MGEHVDTELAREHGQHEHRLHLGERAPYAQARAAAEREVGVAAIDPLAAGSGALTSS